VHFDLKRFKSQIKISRLELSTRASMGGHHPVWLLTALFLVLLPVANTELTPPYFNLAEGRKITASSTCGLDIDGPELYCKLVGSHTDDQQNKTAFDVHDDPFHSASLSRQGHVVIQGQVRDTMNEVKKNDRN
jgi:Laminin N-terminal (Domain VI)